MTLKRFAACAMSAALALALMPAAAFAADDAPGIATAVSHDVSAYREAKYGTPPNGDNSTAGQHVAVTATYGSDLTVTDADALKTQLTTSGNLTSGVSTIATAVQSAEVSVEGKTITVDLTIPMAVMAGSFSSTAFTLDGVNAGGTSVQWPEMNTYINTGLKFHVTDVTIGTATTPASTTVKVDQGAVVRSMNHILWTSNGSAIMEGTGADQTTTAHHHAWYAFTTSASAYSITSNAASLADLGYTVTTTATVDPDTWATTNDNGGYFTITANTPKEGEYLGVYNYSDEFLQANGLTAADHVTGLAMQTVALGTASITGSYTYTSKAIEPAVTVTNADGNVVDPANYSVSYANNTNAGTATATVTGTGAYTGTVKASFTIAKASQSLTAKSAKKTVKKAKVKKKAKTYTFKTSGKKTSLQAKKLTKKQKKAIKSVKVSGNNVKVTVKKGAKKGSYKIQVRAKSSNNYNASSYKTITIKVK